jgi:hypothetical protein
MNLGIGENPGKIFIWKLHMQSRSMRAAMTEDSARKDLLISAIFRGEEYWEIHLFPERTPQSMKF